MATQDFKRKLTAILSADAKGYSRLMGDDEEDTVSTITAYREVIGSVVQKHRGRVVDSPGDNILAEFSSVVDAVRGAVKIQEELATRNAELPEKRRMEFRLGINLGDVIHEKERIYGDGVNVAARIESLAEGGTTCISGSAFEQVKNKLELGYEYLGEHSVKNIAEPVRVYRVLTEPEAIGKVIGEERAEPRKGQRAALAVIIVLLSLVGGLLIWRTAFPPLQVASVEKMAFPLPDKPSIAVLAFDNMSGDPKQEYFSDGITEDLITDLSKISGLFVIARNSSFTYKGKPVKVKQVAEELGVRYVLEGSVRRADGQVRINAQLIDATTGGHLWAERYDGQMDNVFDLQDKITRKIVSALAVQLTAADEQRVTGKETDSAEAYDAFLKGWAHYWRVTPDDYVRAVPYFKKAVNLDPNYSRAYAALAAIYWRAAKRGWYSSLGLSYWEAHEKAKQYLQEAMKEPTVLAHFVASDMHRDEAQHQEAITDATRAIVLDANDPIAYLAMARALIWIGNPAEAADSIKKAMRLDPNYPPEYLVILGWAQFGMERFEEAAVSLEQATKRNPDNQWGFIFLAATYGQLGREQEAKSAMATFNKLRAKEGWSHPYTLQHLRAWDFKEKRDLERFREGLHKAGVPPGPDPTAASKDLISRTKEGLWEVEGATTADVATVKALFDRGVSFVDVRSEPNWKAGHIPGAVNLDLYEVFTEVELSKIVRKDHDVVIYCDHET